jgi:hypothetical protein
MKKIKKNNKKSKKNNFLKDYAEIDDDENNYNNEDSMRKFVDPNKIYTVIKYRDIYYTMGDFLILKDKETRSYVIGQLIEIIPMYGTTKYPFWPSIKIQRQIFFLILDIIKRKISISERTVSLKQRTKILSQNTKYLSQQIL